MADASLNFDENLLDKESSLYQLYTRLYAGMVAANEVTAPDITTDPPLTESGEIDAEAIAIVLKDYSTTLMKNSAFLFANSISNCIDVEVGGIDIDTSSLLSRNGDSMLGLLSALYGFRAGVDGTLVFSVGVDGTQKTASVNGRLDVSAGVNVIGEKGLMFGGIQAIYKSQNQLNLQCDKISLIGNTKVDGELNVGYFKANDNGIYYGDHDIYHGGNANRNDVDWKMFDAFISGDLDVAGETLFHGNVVGLEGVSFGYGGAEMISTNAYGVKLSSDL